MTSLEFQNDVIVSLVQILKKEREKILYEESVKIATEEEKQRRKNLGIGNATFDDIVMLVTTKPVTKIQLLSQKSYFRGTICKCDKCIKFI